MVSPRVGTAGDAPLVLLCSWLSQTHSPCLSGPLKLMCGPLGQSLDPEVRGAPAHAHEQQEVPRPVGCGVLCQHSHVRLLNCGTAVGTLTECAGKPIWFSSLFRSRAVLSDDRVRSEPRDTPTPVLQSFLEHAQVMRISTQDLKQERGVGEESCDGTSVSSRCPPQNAWHGRPSDQGWLSPRPSHSFQGHPLLASPCPTPSKSLGACGGCSRGDGLSPP